MKIKSFIILFLVFVLLFSSGCNKNENNGNVESQVNSATEDVNSKNEKQDIYLLEPELPKDFEETKLTKLQTLYYYITNEYPMPAELLFDNNTITAEMGINLDYIESYFGGYSGTNYTKDYCVVFKIKPGYNEEVIKEINTFIGNLQTSVKNAENELLVSKFNNPIIKEYNDVILVYIAGNTQEIDDIGEKAYYEEVNYFVEEAFSLYKVDLLPTTAKLEYITANVEITNNEEDTTTEK